MGWSRSEAEELLRRAFPWGAHVTVQGGSEFVAIRYTVQEIDEGNDAAVVMFERSPGDTVQRVTRVALEAATRFGVLELGGGARVRQPEVDDLHYLASPFRDLIGPQSPGESGWTARMRLHQSWWRTFRLRTPFGTGPQKDSTKRYGNMLDADGDARGLNFLTQEGREAYDQRVALSTAGVHPFRTRRNLLASQPMAFNVFGHLSSYPDLASGLFRALLGSDEVAEVTSIELERLSTALGDRTAFDAFATYRRPDSTAACVAIETKLTEPFSQDAYDWGAYVAHPAFDSGVWNTTDTATLGDRRWSQLWRNHLLARAESTAHPKLGPSTVLIVHHPLDPHCRTNVDGYRQLLQDPATVKAVDLGGIRDALSDLVKGDDYQGRWLTDLSDRYLNLRLSDPLVELRRHDAS